MLNFTNKFPTVPKSISKHLLFIAKQKLRYPGSIVKLNMKRQKLVVNRIRLKTKKTTDNVRDKKSNARRKTTTTVTYLQQSSVSFATKSDNSDHSQCVPQVEDDLKLKRFLENSIIIDVLINTLIFCIPAKLIETCIKLFPIFNCETKLVLYGFFAVLINDRRPALPDFGAKLEWIFRLMLIIKALSIFTTLFANNGPTGRRRQAN